MELKSLRAYLTRQEKTCLGFRRSRGVHRSRRDRPLLVVRMRAVAQRTVQSAVHSTSDFRFLRTALGGSCEIAAPIVEARPRAFLRRGMDHQRRGCVGADA